MRSKCLTEVTKVTDELKQAFEETDIQGLESEVREWMAIELNGMEVGSEWTEPLLPRQSEELGPRRGTTGVRLDGRDDQAGGSEANDAPMSFIFIFREPDTVHEWIQITAVQILLMF